MTETEPIVLEVTGPTYGSYNDEASFFGWLDRIPAVRAYGGRVRILSIDVDPNLDEASLHDLIAIFSRYRLDMKQLRVFDGPAAGEWFRDPQKYWHEAIFGPTQTSSEE